MGFEFFTLIDLISFFGWLFFFILIVHIIYARNRENPDFKYFLPHFYWKMFMGLAFGLVYILYYERHGDTVFYWDGAKKLNLLLYENPTAYWHEIFSSPSTVGIPSYFNASGRPPWWIYAESNSWFVCKVANFLSFLSFGSYLTLNLFFSVISTWVSWKFFRFINSIVNTKTSYVALACLFVPSVSFWCTGIIKDTIAICAVLIFTISILKIIRKEYSSFFAVALSAVLAIYVMIGVRPFLVICLFLAIFMILIFRVNNEKPFIVKFLTRSLGLLLVIGGVTYYFSNPTAFGEFSSESVFQTAETIQKDLINNTGYTGKKYYLNIVDFSGISLLYAAPAAISTAIYRPFLWESDSVFMLMNGLENLVILVLSLRLFRLKNRENISNEFRNNTFYLYALTFVLILGFFVGLTSGLFGTLVRLKAPIMPFFLLIVFLKLTDENKFKLKLEE